MSCLSLASISMGWDDVEIGQGHQSRARKRAAERLARFGRSIPVQGSSTGRSACGLWPRSPLVLRTYVGGLTFKFRLCRLRRLEIHAASDRTHACAAGSESSQARSRPSPVWWPTHHQPSRGPPQWVKISRRPGASSTSVGFSISGFWCSYVTATRNPFEFVR